MGVAGSHGGIRREGVGVARVVETFYPYATTWSVGGLKREQFILNSLREKCCGLYLFKSVAKWG